MHADIRRSHRERKPVMRLGIKAPETRKRGALTTAGVAFTATTTTTIMVSDYATNTTKSLKMASTSVQHDNGKPDVIVTLPTTIDTEFFSSRFQQQEPDIKCEQTRRSPRKRKPVMRLGRVHAAEVGKEASSPTRTFTSTTRRTITTSELGTYIKPDDLLHYIKSIDTWVNSVKFQLQKSGYFYQLPLSFGVECIVDKRLDTMYSLAIRDKKHARHKEESRYTEDTVDQFYRIYSSSVSPPDHLKDVLLSAISNDKNLYYRWLLSNSNIESILEDVFASAINNKNISINILKALAWKIINMFFTKYKDKLRSQSAIGLWPGFICKCHKKEVSGICSSEFVIIIESISEIKNIPEKFLVFDIKQFQLNREYKEAMIVNKKQSEYCSEETLDVNCVVSGTVAEALFHNHRNLTLICPSVAKSTGMSKDHNVYPLFCIQLFCIVKGVIPIGENHFPSIVSGLPTDVLEGCPQMAANNIIVGEKIGTIDLQGKVERQGTLGGFTKHLGYECFMTCAHVAFDLKSLMSRVDDEIDDNGVKIFKIFPDSKPSISPYGQVIKRVFEHSDKDKTSIDVALVQLQNSSIDQNFFFKDPFGFPRPMSYLGLTSVDLRRNCIDLVDICNSRVRAICLGAFSKFSDITTVGPTIEYETIHMPTPGMPIPAGAFQLLLCHNCHMQLHAGYLSSRETFQMYNQLKLNLPLQVGDSGTCIYVQTNTGKTGCIGMAIAFGPGGYSIVTPLRDILKKLKH